MAEISSRLLAIRDKLGPRFSVLATFMASVFRAALKTFFWLLGLAILIACAFALFRNAIMEGQVYYRLDTILYYFPLADRFADVLRQGRLMLWTQYLFGGFPLFADGEVAMLYPPNLIAYLFFPSDAIAFVWLRVIRYVMASVFTYCYLRALRLNGFAATIGALSFVFGSFMIAQMAHNNVINTAIWLPLTLCFVELAVRNVRRKRWIYATFAGVSVGIQALGLHIQPLIMSGFFLAFYIPFRVLLCPIDWPGRKTRPARVEWRQTVIPSASGGQDIPGEMLESAPAVPSKTMESELVILAEAKDLTPGETASPGRRNGKPGGADRRAKKMLRCPIRALALCSLASSAQHDLAPWIVRFVWAGCLPWIGRHLAGTFHRVVLAGLLLGLIPAIAFGIAATQVIPLVELGLFSTRGHGVSYQFSTAFSLPMQNLVTLLFPYFFRYTDQQYYWSLWSEWENAFYVGIAPLVLATIAIFFARRRLVIFFAAMTAVSLMLAFGGYAPYPLWDQIRGLPGFSSLRVPARFTMITTLSLAVLAAFGVDWLCRTLRPAESGTKSGWGRLSRFAGIHGFGIYLIGLVTATAGLVWWLVSFRLWTEKDPNAVKIAIQQSYLSLRNDRPWLTADQVLSFLRYSLDPTNPRTELSLRLLLGTVLLLLAWFAFRRLWRVWASALVLLVAADMLTFATDFHPTMSIDQLTTPNGAASWLMAQNTNGRTRVYTTPGVRRTEPNKLVPFQLEEITGYSSLQTKRHQEYMAKMIENEQAFLDLYGARFVVMQRNPTALPSYRYAGYNPNRPLADGPAGGANATATFYMNPPVRTDEVLVISSLRDSVEILNGANVAEITVVDTSGERVTVSMKVGMDTSEWAYDRSDVTPHMRHNRSEVAGQVMVTDPDGRRYQANLYFGDLLLDKTRTVQRVEYRYTYPKGAMRLYGLALWENPSTAHQVLSRYRYLPRYQDDEVAIMENPSALPEAYLVPGAKVLPSSKILDTMANGVFDPTRTALLEPPQPDGLFPDGGGADDRVTEWLKGNADQSPGRAEITSYMSTDVAIRTSSESNALLFLADSYYPGWKALVDGKEEKIYRADYLFRAVPVPAGQHEVRFVFEPETVAVGMDISRFTVVTLVLAWAALIILPAIWSGAMWLRSKARGRRARPLVDPDRLGL